MTCAPEELMEEKAATVYLPVPCVSVLTAELGDEGWTERKVLTPYQASSPLAPWKGDPQASAWSHLPSGRETDL